MIGGAAVGVLLLLLANLSLWGFVGLLVVFGLYEVIVYRAGISTR